MDDFEKELKIGFLDEAAQSVSEVEQCYLLLETNPEDTKTLDKIFRLAHNLKGSSKAVGFDELGAFTHELESLLLKLKNGDLKVTARTVSLLLRCNDFINSSIDKYRGDFAAKLYSDDLILEIQKHAAGQDAPEEESNTDVDTPVDSEVVDVPDAALFEETSIAVEPMASTATENPVSTSTPTENLFEIPNLEVAETPAVTLDLPTEAATPAEETPNVAIPHLQLVEDAVNPATAEGSKEKNTVEVKAPVTPQAGPAPVAPHSEDKKSKTSAAATDESIRVSLARLEKLQNFVGEMVILQAVLREQVQQVDSHLLRKTVHQIGKVAKEVQDVSMGLRMVPIKPTFQKMQRIVRDVASALKKNIQFTIAGEETELDKTVLERINDPLVHLVRNSVDHGIEDVNTRTSRGKTPEGKVQLKAYHQSGKLVIEISDDGGGLDPEKLKSVAVKKGILKPGAIISDKDAQALIFAPGFSTKAEVTDISGRGVGMDVVKTNIAELGGEILIQSQVGTGTTFKILLPLTLAIVDAMVVRVGTSRFVVPLAMVHESLSPKTDEIKVTTGLGEILLLRGENIPLYRVFHLLGMKIKESSDVGTVIVVRAGEQPFGVAVDEIIGQYQIVIKQLGPEIQGLQGISGCSILGDGRPALILEPVDLVKRAQRNTSSSAPLRKAA